MKVCVKVLSVESSIFFIKINKLDYKENVGYVSDRIKTSHEELRPSLRQSQKSKLSPKKKVSFEDLN